MAERRMFAKTIVLSDAFLDMPLSARCLYFTLGMLADDDGFINSPTSVMRQCGASNDDMALLFNKSFLIPFESGVVVIKHWRINNYLRNDRYVATKYTDEKSRLKVEENGRYTIGIPVGIPSIDKDSIGKVSIEPNTHTCVRKAQGTPSLEDVKGFFKANGLTLDAQRFYSFNAARGWVDKNGNPIEDWQQLALAWQAKEPKATKTHTYTEDQLNALVDDINEVDF